MKSFHQIACQLGIVGALVVCEAGMSAVGLDVASASTVVAETLKVSGAGSGTLKPGQYAGCLNQGLKTNGLTAVNDLVGNISGYSNDVGYWSLDVTIKKLGPSKFAGNLSAKPIAELFAAAKDNNFSKTQNDQFFAKTGTVTVSASTGSINASFANPVGKSITVVGTWKC